MITSLGTDAPNVAALVYIAGFGLDEGESIGAECFQADGGHCCIAPACHLRGVLDEAFRAFYTVLDSYTLEDLLANRQVLAKLLPVQMPMHRV